jgi:hypothetical protein
VAAATLWGQGHVVAKEPEGCAQKPNEESFCGGPLSILPWFSSLLRSGCVMALVFGKLRRCGCCRCPRRAYGSSSNFRSVCRTRKWSHRGLISTAGWRVVASQRSATATLLLLLCHVDGGRWLLLQRHAVLMHRLQLALHRRDRCTLASHQFLGGGVRCPKICNRLAVGYDGCIVVVDGGHPVSV